MSAKLFNIILLVSLLIVWDKVFGHGRMIDPPGRSTAWRYGFPTPKNYDDNQLYCGGFQTQWSVNGGKCGICGDPYNGKRENEVPDGTYAKKLYIVKTYKSGDAIDVKIDITANHNGFFEFKICPATDDKKEVTQKCLDSHQLKVLNSQSADKYIVPSPKPQIFTVKLQLPAELTCKRCVLQWRYTAGNRWGPCGNGTSAEGCGPQETFMACADVAINANKHVFELDNDLDNSIF